MFAARFRLKIIAEAAAPKSQEFTCEFPSAYHFNYYSN
uniref:RE02247p n=1 Tax=Drosophila melanogaster TaxID=7227 RepID=Q8SZF8_DROME|nr:RE02247p [Drosophila melanogaster]